MNNFEVDVSAAQQMMEELSTKKLMYIERKALKKAANVVRKQARSNFKKELRKATQPSAKYNDTLIEGIMTSTKETSEGVIAKVHIMGTRRKGSGTFRTRFFEASEEKERKTKKGYSRGVLHKLNFFAPALTSTQAKVESTIDVELTKTIQAIADKKYG